MAQDDTKQLALPIPGTDNSVSIEMIKSVFIGEGLSIKDIAIRYHQDPKDIEAIVVGNKLEELRAIYLKEGIKEIQNVQLNQARKIMDIETNFKNMRIIQLQKTLEDFSAYYGKHGHFYQLHPLTGEILVDRNGIPVQLKLPDVSKEIAALKESVSLSEGLKNIVGQIDSILHKKSTREAQPLDDEGDIIDVTSYNQIFKKSKRED